MALVKPSTSEVASTALGQLSLSPSNKITCVWRCAAGLMGPGRGAHTAKFSPAMCALLCLSPRRYNDYNHARFAPGTEGRPFAYFVQTGGRFLYASAIRVVVLKALVSLSASSGAPSSALPPHRPRARPTSWSRRRRAQAAADTLALSSLEVDLTGLEEGSTITVKWRGKPVFIQHRTDEQIASAASVALTDLKDPQKDIDRVVDPKYLIVIGVCTHLGCVPIAGAGNYGGWFCPCHGSHYDGSGRIREGPAPYNLEIPEYRFTEGKVIIG